MKMPSCLSFILNCVTRYFLKTIFQCIQDCKLSPLTPYSTIHFSLLKDFHNRHCTLYHFESQGSPFSLHFPTLQFLFQHESDFISQAFCTQRYLPQVLCTMAIPSATTIARKPVCTSMEEAKDCFSGDGDQNFIEISPQYFLVNTKIGW